ncbi:MAG: agmatinase [Clostridia bacterium]|nr:agmatinase [Clostridia bacterium]
MLKDKKPQSEFFYCSYDECEIAVFGIPYDGTASYRPGTRFGPDAIRNEMYGLETYSPYLDKDLNDYRVCDLGDLEIPFGNREGVLQEAAFETKSILQDNKKIVMLGGEHLVSYPVIKELHQKYSDLHVIHFDAHTDLRDEFFGEAFSHATVIKRVHDFLGDDRIYQFGIRSGTKKEFEFGRAHTNLHAFDTEGLKDAVSKLKGKSVYITIDLDVLDPSIFPGTGTPEAGGITFKEMMEAIKDMNGLNIVGADIVELSPHYDASGVSTAVACKILRELLLIMA